MAGPDVAEGVGCFVEGVGAVLAVLAVLLVWSLLQFRGKPPRSPTLARGRAQMGTWVAGAGAIRL